MKKLLILSAIIITVFFGQKAFAELYHAASLRFTNITDTQANVSFVYGMQSDAYDVQIANRAPIKIQWRPWMCGDDQTSNKPCPMMMAIRPSVITLDYGPNGELLPVVLTNLQPNTKYRVWLGYNDTRLINCIQAPCYGVDTWQDQTYSFTTLSSNSNPDNQILNQKLYFSVRGTQVNILENFLQGQGYMNNYIDTYFGTVTHAAVIKFQRDHGLKGDGVVGPVTRAIMNQMIINNPSIYSVSQIRTQ